MTAPVRPLLAGLVLAVVTAAVLEGFLMAGSPLEARRRRLDDRRVSDLREVQGAMNLHWTRTKTMPDSIESALKGLAWSQRPVDPVTAAPYEYRAIDATSYELCAVFDRASQDAPALSSSGDPFWSHSPGRQCFTLEMKELGK